MMMIASALDLGHRQLPTPQDLPAAERQGGCMLPHMDPGRLPGTVASHWDAVLPLLQ